jgi:hypothetical protein
MGIIIISISTSILGGGYYTLAAFIAFLEGKAHLIFRFRVSYQGIIAVVFNHSL